MRTYLAVGDDGLVLKCVGCGDVTDLRKLLDPISQRMQAGITSINTLRLTEVMGRYGMEHSEHRAKE